MGDRFFLQVISKMILNLLLIISSAMGLSTNQEPNRNSLPEIMGSLRLVKASNLIGSNYVAALGDGVVVTEKMFNTFNLEEVKSFRGYRLMVVFNTETGQFGASDGGIIVRLEPKVAIEDIAVDHGMTVLHTFGAVPMGVLMPHLREETISKILTMRDDPRVGSVVLDVNYYDKTPR